MWVTRGRKGQASLLAPPKTSTLRAAEIRSEKERSFDLLDALSCSGVIRLEAASLHVVLAVTHAFDESLMDVVIGQNVNPIEKLERTSLILASAVQALPAARLVRPSEVARVATYSAPALLPPQDGADDHRA